MDNIGAHNRTPEVPVTTTVDIVGILSEEVTHIVKRLQVSLLVQQLWPEAFEAGKPIMVSFSGTLPVFSRAKLSAHIASTWQLVLTRADKSQKKFHLCDVPTELISYHYNNTNDSGLKVVLGVLLGSRGVY